jgi:ribonuclease D
MVLEIEKEPRLAVDTESNSLYVYKEEVCLVQISSPRCDYLIDPFALRDLSPLGALFLSKVQEKIFHASEYDLICLKRDFHFKFNNIFDTMVAARILGEPQVGLGSLLQTKFGIELDKHYQRANWGGRPLSKEMLDYARLDTHYLFQLRDLLANDLIAHSLMDLALEDFQLACKVKPHVPEADNHGCWKVAGSNHVSPRQAAILQELCSFREDQARRANLPPFRIFSNQLLFDISEAVPHTLEELGTLHGVSEKILKRRGEGLLHAVVKGESSPPVTRQRRPRPDVEFIRRLGALKEWRKSMAKELKVESVVVLPKETMERIAGDAPKNLNELEEVMADTPVRFSRFSNLILEAAQKKESE